MDADLLAWFRARTFHADDFSLDELVARKAELGLAVSVVLPARNEAASVEGVVDAVRELGGRLVDELVVMDGASSDGTARLAAEAGGRVHADDAVLPQFGSSQGKGDALWRSLSVTSGDVVVFVDADVRNPHPRFVSALLGPLLVVPEIALVKAFYERPLRVGGHVVPAGGGRVTELCARPLLNAHWPALAGLVQPLAGEYAARRGLLEQLPFFTGYGVEFGLLVDTLAAAGASSIAQVDLGRRVHRNQSMPALSRMAYGILQVALQRLRVADVPNAYVQFGRDETGRLTLEPATVAVLERPPLASLRSA